MSHVARFAVTLALGTAVVAPAPAEAQEPQRNVPVAERARPDYDSLGIRAGSFFIFPSLSLSGVYDDNVNAAPDDEEDDFGAIVAPSVSVRSNWSRHALFFDVGGEAAFFQDITDNNYQDAFATLGGRLDITRSDVVTAQVGVAREHQSRASPDQEEDQEDLTLIYRADAVVGYRHRFNRVFVAPAFSANRFDFEHDDFDEDDRDRWRYRPSVRVGYQVSPRFNVFGQASYNWVRYDQTPNRAGIDRNSEGFAVGLGSEVDITGILFGEVSAGYRRQEYDDDDLDTVDGVGASGTLTWNITTLTSLVLDVSADVLETTVSFEGEQASSDFQKAVSLGVQHELLRNLLLFGNVGYVRDDFEGTDRSDDTINAGLGASYLLNRNLSLDATYDFSHRSSDDDDEDYTRNIVRIGVTARL